MRRILIAIDGSDNALRAVRQVVSLAPELREPPQLLLANVQPVVVSGGVRTFVNADQVDTWYRSEGEKALASARDLLAAAGDGPIGIAAGELIPAARNTLNRLIAAHA